jgi:hypothetical protein
MGAHVRRTTSLCQRYEKQDEKSDPAQPIKARRPTSTYGAIRIAHSLVRSKSHQKQACEQNRTLAGAIKIAPRVLNLRVRTYLMTGRIPAKATKHLNSLTAIDGHDRQYFNELRSTVVSCRIFIRSQSLIARWTRNDFSSPAVSRNFYEAFLIDNVSRGSKSYLFRAS